MGFKLLQDIIFDNKKASFALNFKMFNGSVRCFIEKCILKTVRACLCINAP